jgi:WD40 repeat protein
MNPSIDAGGPVWKIAFSPDSATLAATYVQPGPQAGMAAVWGVADGALRYRVPVDDAYGTPGAATFSPDGSLLATGGGTGFVRLWDARTGQQSGQQLLTIAGRITNLEFTPDGRSLISTGTDGTVRMIDVASRQQPSSPLPGGEDNSMAVLSPDGSRLYVVYGDDGHGYAWDIAPADLAAHACVVAGRILTQDEWARYLPDRPYAPACTSGVVSDAQPSSGAAAEQASATP